MERSSIVGLVLAMAYAFSVAIYGVVQVTGILAS